MTAKHAEVQEVTLYHATTNSDTTEGRGRTVTIGWFLHEEIAYKAVKGQGVMGSDASVEPKAVRVVTVRDADTNQTETYLLGDRVELSYEDPAEIRARGLAKLSPAERKALGL